jgi:flagellar protein FliS
MKYQEPYSAYQKAQETVSELHQVIMLYEGAINFIEQAKDAIREGNFEKRYNLINKAIAIVTGLNSCLEFNDRTNSVATALDQYYQSIDMRLLYIQCDNSITSCDTVIDDLRIMLNAWKDVARETNGAKEEPMSMPMNPQINGSTQVDLEITV